MPTSGFITANAASFTPTSFRGGWNNSAGAVTTQLSLTKEDDSTPAWTAEVSGEAAATPIVSIDPA